jgi:hypothetical protein
LGPPEDTPVSPPTREMVSMIRRLLSFSGALFLLALVYSPVSAQVKAPAMAHDPAGKENCLMCHAAGVMEPVPDIPASHEGRTNAQCLWCHAPDSPMVTTGAKAPSHDLAGKDNCMMCHAVGVMPPVPDVPASHEGRTNDVCLWCHKAAG